MALPEPGALFGLPPVKVYKSDARSRVWRVETAAGPVVVKRFEFSPLRQRLLALLGLHPMQREVRITRMLLAAGVRAAPILGHGVDRAAGGRYWIATPWKGQSVYMLLKRGGFRDFAGRRASASAVAEVTAALLNAGLAHRDHRLNNMLLDEHGDAWLVDVMGVRRSRGESDVLRTITALAVGSQRIGMTRGDRWRFLTALVKFRPGLGDPRQLAGKLAGL